MSTRTSPRSAPRPRPWRRLAAAAAGCAALLLATVTPAATGAPATGAGPAAARHVPVQPEWASAGQNNHNTRNAATEHTIGPRNVGTLAPKWVFTADGDISATPTVVHGTVYVPDWGGKLWAVDADSGKAVWSHSIADYDGVEGHMSRTSPAYWQGSLYLGTGTLTTTALKSAYIISVDARTGAKQWMTKVDDDPTAVVTSSPTVDDGVVYVGVSSKASTLHDAPGFRGSVMALDAHTGKILWKTYTIPEGYTGASVWGSQPVVDHKTGLVFVGTGNNYTSPPGVCLNPKQTDCTPPAEDDHFDSVLALDLKTGRIRWSHHTLTADTWMMYQQNQAPDFDFGSAPNLYTTEIDGKPKELLGIGQKSGVYYTLEPATGKVVWQTQVGPGGALGGIQWGSATDGKRIYVGIGNGDHLPWTITAADGTKSTVDSGFFAAVDAATGKIEWQTADPQGKAGKWLDDSFITHANGVMYAGSSAPSGTNMYALDADTGKILWDYASGGSVWGGAAVVDGSVYWGSGYYISNVGEGLSGHNNKLYRFTPGGR
ncbi:MULTISPECIES: outer membrane protein assembly factor BamB family protein [Streptomyces]|uniref:Probable polyvinylalcohol dehydrogenase n=1 Tax=Streptomyces rochei TaxID=1928 RepID=Q83X81_STRRO|nr:MULTISPECIES: PQQ-binding-like beta-propeller repeat protein [Streptomyces]MBA9050694.1 polyvinyl alcohol dehydrogenase (cytochrome) [Streptomyces murinus]BAC76481.1 probable polyvinylalcohol dehydrogenase [Streptomyces rochei]